MNRKPSHYNPLRQPAGERLTEAYLSTDLGLSDESIDLIHTFGYSVRKLIIATDQNGDMKLVPHYFVYLNDKPASVGLTIRQLQEFFECLTGGD